MRKIGDGHRLHQLTLKIIFHLFRRELAAECVKSCREIGRRHIFIPLRNMRLRIPSVDVHAIIRQSNGIVFANIELLRRRRGANREHRERQRRELYGKRRQMASRRPQRSGIEASARRTRRGGSEIEGGQMSAPAPSMFTPAAKAMAEKLGLKMGRANLEEFAATLEELAKPKVWCWV